MSLKNKSVLVTGGAGFIGSHLVDRIVEEEPGHIVVVDNFFLGNESNLKEASKTFSNLKIYNQDAFDYEVMCEIMKNESIDVVFNLAVIPLPASLVKPRWAFEQNVTIICGVTIGEYAMVGAGSVVTKNVLPFSLVFGNPTRLKGFVCYCGKRVSNIVEDEKEKVIYRCECGKAVRIIKEWIKNG